jgi:hypothetical protein
VDCQRVKPRGLGASTGGALDLGVPPVPPLGTSSSTYVKSDLPAGHPPAAAAAKEVGFSEPRYLRVAEWKRGSDEGLAKPPSQLPMASVPREGFRAVSPDYIVLPAGPSIRKASDLT